MFYDQDARGKARNAHVGVIGVGDRPLRLPAVEAVLNGNVVDEATIAKAEAAASAAVEPQDDIHASAAYRRALVGTMVERALQERMRPDASASGRHAGAISKSTASRSRSRSSRA